MTISEVFMRGLGLVQRLSFLNKFCKIYLTTL